MKDDEFEEQKYEISEEIGPRDRDTKRAEKKVVE